MLAGPAFIAVFSVSGVLLSVLSDKLSDAVSRVVLVGLGAATFSAGLNASLQHCIITVSLTIITVSTLYHHCIIINHLSACVLMGLASSYWQLVILRTGEYSAMKWNILFSSQRRFYNKQRVSRC